MTGQPKRTVRPIPEGFHAITSYLTVPGVPKLIEFLEKAFDARLIMRMDGPGGAVMHAEMRIGDSIVMMGEPQGPWQPRPCNLYLYVNDCDAAYRSAIEAGAKSLNEPKDQFYGDRTAAIEDLSGNNWWIATHVEDVPPDELRKRMAAMPKH
jgi:PhnB protein